MPAISRAHQRAADELRPVVFEPRFTSSPDGSVLVKLGRTWVMCTASSDEWLPFWRRGSGKGWLTASYSMLPGSTDSRIGRERSGAKGRTLEIERLIGRSLRAALDLSRLGERTIFIDCDVLQADGGTRTAAITGGWLALSQAVGAMISREELRSDPIVRQVAAVSVGLVDDEPLLDLDYQEDLRAQADLNIVMTAEGQFVEVQGTAEGPPFGREELDAMLGLAGRGIDVLGQAQMGALDGD
jgi:ribonuclease PH